MPCCRHKSALTVPPSDRAMEEGESAPVRTTSTLSSGTPTSDAAGVSESLEGLVFAVDELKKSMGLGEQVDFAAVEQYIHRLRHENEEFRQFAEEAILVGGGRPARGQAAASAVGGGLALPSSLPASQAVRSLSTFQQISLDCLACLSSTRHLLAATAVCAVRAAPAGRAG